MTTNDAKSRLYDTTFLIGSFRRRAAIKALAESPDPTGVVVLAEALGKGHPAAARLSEVLLRLSAQRDADKVRALWTAWVSAPTAPVAAVLARLGWPRSHVVDVKAAREVLGVANLGVAPEVHRAVAVFARALPVADEVVNDAIYGAWVRAQSAELEKLITEQRRQPGSPAGVVVLAEALGKGHPNAGRLSETLLHLSDERTRTR